MKANIKLDLSVYPDADKETVKRIVKTHLSNLEFNLNEGLDWAVNKVELEVEFNEVS